jgi:diguanylate cyclase (GGDEF)-like protein/putative nucleotidyltransferase with HDIG domain
VVSQPADRNRQEALLALLEIGRAMRAGGDLQPVLAAVASAVRRATGFGTVVINLHRPAWDDFEVVVVEGSEDAREVLMGATTQWPGWSGLLLERFDHGGAYFIPAGSTEWAMDGATYVPDIAPSDDPDAWDAEDGLMVPLRASTGGLLGIVSVDEPVDGRRPDDAALALIAAVCDHAAAAIEHAQATASARRHSAAVDHLLRVSAQVSAGQSAREVLGAVCAGIRDALGFAKVMVLLPQGERGLVEPLASVGWEPTALGELTRAPLDVVARLFEPELLQEGCALLELQDALARLPEFLHDIYPSESNGRGPRAWNRHWLLVPLYDRVGAVGGFIWVDDPVDLLLPTAERLQALRAFANQAATAIESANQLADLRRLAEHDPLTGLRNRRGFRDGIDAGIAGAETLSLLICDLDNFKRVNDSLGHEAGDRVLEGFAELMRDCTRTSDVPTRLGGEEFALVLPGAGEAEAMAVAERLRRSVRGRFADHAVTVSVSIGVATTGAELRTSAGLMRAANRALYAAKHLGRDRSVAYHAQTLEMLDAVRGADGAAREHLAAAMLLAETLDLRDVGTARHSETVGRYAEQIARALGWSLARVERVRAAGILHDIGKLGISDAILHKPGRLDAHEWEEMRRHPELGARILEHANVRDIAGWVLAHHERVDGAGYPRGLSGDAIPAEARILAVADAYEAMTADRPYRRALPADAARDELRRGAGSQFDARVVEAFLAAHDAREEAAAPPLSAPEDPAAAPLTTAPAPPVEPTAAPPTTVAPSSAARRAVTSP